MKYFGRLARTDNWLQSKIPPIMSVLFAGILTSQVGSSQAYMLLVSASMSILSVAVYGHFINDMFDVEEDRLANKPNLIGSLPPYVQFSLCLFCVIVGFLPCYALKQGVIPCLLLLLNYVAPTVYSAPPFSLKNRGLAGVITDSLGAHVIPSLFILSLVAESTERSDMSDKVFLAFLFSTLIWSFFFGLRGIIIHQVVNRQKDLAANVVTFGGLWQPEQLRALVINWFLPIEILSVSVFVFLSFRTYPLYFSFYLLYFALELAKIHFKWRLPVFLPDTAFKENYIPFLNNELYEIWLPCTLLLAMVTYNGSFVVLLFCYLIIFRSGLNNRSRVILNIVLDIKNAICK